MSSVIDVSRRRFVAGAAACAAWANLPQAVRAEAGGRVVVVGGGWGGLAAARWLREWAPNLQVTLVERNAEFRSLPLSNKWLAGLIGEEILVHDYAVAARAWGYRFLRADVRAIDREKRRVHTDSGMLDYDWLVLAAGIRNDYAAWFGNDREAIDYTRRHYPCAFTAGDELSALKRKLDLFAGGDLLMTIPPAPFRCPPAPYERALMIGWLIKTRGTKGRLIVLDPNPGYQGFNRRFAEEYRDQITYLPETRVRRVDPGARRIETEFDEFRFDDAILMPPQQAADPVWQAGLIGRDSAGQPHGWGLADPLRLHALGDERVYLVGDLVGPVSSLFGHYPKSGQMAARMGRIVAGEIAARAAGRTPEPRLPDSACLVTTRIDPPEAMRIDTSYRFRGDGVVVQSVRQTQDNQPRGEDVAWAQGLFKEFIAP